MFADLLVVMGCLSVWLGFGFDGFGSNEFQDWFVLGWSVVMICWWVDLWLMVVLVAKSAWVSGLRNRHGSRGCKIGVDQHGWCWPWVMGFGHGYGWCWVCLLMGWVCLLWVVLGLLLFLFSFSGGGGFDECGCGWVCDWWWWRWWLMVVVLICGGFNGCWLLANLW